MAVIRKCMKYLEEAAKASYVRDAEIDLAREDYATDQFRQLQDLLEEFVSFTPQLQKRLLNYRRAYELAQEQMSREITHQFLTGEFDPGMMLARERDRDRNP